MQNQINSTLQAPTNTYLYSDPIVDEVHAIRKQMLDAHGGDVDAWFNDLLSKQAKRLSAQTANTH